MNTRLAVGIGAVTAATLVTVAAGVLQARDAMQPRSREDERILYLRSARTATRAFLSFDALAADVYWMRTIQHYGRDRKSARTVGRFELLQPLIDLTTTLDPHFNLAYRFGAIFLAMDPPNGPGRPDQAIALLQKGLAANPARWQYAHDIGFIHYWYTGDYPTAAHWFERASTMPGAPAWIRPLASVTLLQGGDREGARALLAEQANANEPYIRAAAERSLAQLRTLDLIDDVQSRVAAFSSHAGHYPADWHELVTSNALPGIPLDPAGVPLVYDAESHRVAISPTSSLAPLPTALGRR